MTIFFKILSIIGIILLVVLALILLIVLEVLFVPIRYKAKAYYKENEPEKLYAVARASWLLHIVSFKYDYSSSEHFFFKIFGFKVNLKKSEGKDKKKIDFDSEDEEEEEEKDSKKEVLLANEADSKEASKNEESKDKDDTLESDSSNRNIYDKIKLYLKIVQSKLFKKTYKKSKDKVIKILKNILPRQWNIRALIGFDDPSTTGSLIAFTSMLYALIHKHIQVYGDFENKVIDAEGFCKGHISIFVLLVNALKIYLDKNIRKLIKMFKEV